MNYSLSDFKYIVALDRKEIWWSSSLKSVPVTYEIIWLFTTIYYNDFLQRIVSL